MFDEPEPLAMDEAKALEGNVEVLVLSRTVVRKDGQLGDSSREVVLYKVHQTTCYFAGTSHPDSLIPHIHHWSGISSEVVDPKVIGPDLPLVEGNVG